ncbi:MAG: Swt1 family HEPN domain-containing protein [Limnospira sp.]
MSILAESPFEQNHNLINKAFRELLAPALERFIKAKLRQKLGNNWQRHPDWRSFFDRNRSFHQGKNLNWADSYIVLKTVNDPSLWNKVFQNRNSIKGDNFDQYERSLINLLLATRNAIAHPTNTENKKHIEKFMGEIDPGNQTVVDIMLLYYCQNNDDLAGYSACVDRSKFIDRHNPAEKIYTDMVKAGLPKSGEGTPKTMAELQTYWELLECDRTPVLILYDPAELEGGGEKMSDRLLEDLGKFDGSICAVTEHNPTHLQTFSPRDPKLVQNLIKWIAARQLEC